MNNNNYKIKKISENIWLLEAQGDMRVPAKLFVDEKTVNQLVEESESGKEWNALDQVINVASLPGIVGASIGMADIHPGYGFPIGGIGAFDPGEGVVVAGGVGFDINCGVRLLKTPLTVDDISGVKEELADVLYNEIPAGLGSEGDIKLSVEEIDRVLIEGAEFTLNRGYGIEDDLLYIEENGRIKGANPDNVSRRAKQRQFKQIGTLGSGNHYLEAQKVDKIFDEDACEAFGLFEDQVVFSIHTGSRALGHQIGQDYLSKLKEASKKYDIPVKEEELACAPIDSPEGREYISAMQAGINCAFANRQALSDLLRGSLSKSIGLNPSEVQTVYEVGHNTAKFEEHEVQGARRELLVHRKGSTRAFGPGNEEVPPEYRDIGQPVLVGGTMGTYSYVLRGSKKSMELTFGSGIHGAGRKMSRKKAKSKYWGETVADDLAEKGIEIRGHSMPGLAEEAPGAYKSVESVVEAVSSNGVNPKVARLRPIIVVKG